MPGAMSPEQARAISEDPRKISAGFIDRLGAWGKPIFEAQDWTPPGLAARGLREEVQGRRGQALLSLGALGLWMLGGRWRGGCGPSITAKI